MKDRNQKNKIKGLSYDSRLFFKLILTLLVLPVSAFAGLAFSVSPAITPLIWYGLFFSVLGAGGITLSFFAPTGGDFAIQSILTLISGALVLDTSTPENPTLAFQSFKYLPQAYQKCIQLTESELFFFEDELPQLNAISESVHQELYTAPSSIAALETDQIAQKSQLLWEENLKTLTPQTRSALVKILSHPECH